MCLLSFLPGFKSRQGWALQLSNISIKIRIRKGDLDPKKMKTSSSQEKIARERKQMIVSKTATVVTITKKKIS